MKTILLVDDSAEIRNYLSILLQWKNYNVIEAQDGLEGWQLAIDRKPDLILSDIDMPRLNGYELLQKLNLDLNAGRIPVIILSGKMTANARQNALQLGAIEFLEKSLQPDRILDIIDNCLRNRNLPNDRNFKK